MTSNFTLIQVLEKIPCAAQVATAVDVNHDARASPLPRTRFDSFDARFY